MSLKEMRGDGREGKAGMFRKAVSSSHDPINLKQRCSWDR
jgi:hypothetical protein